MNSASLQIPVTFAGLDQLGTVPRWAHDLPASRSTVADLCREPELPELSVIQSTRPQRVLEAEGIFTTFCETLVRASKASARLVLGFQKAEPAELLALAPLLGRVPGLAGRIELARKTTDLQDAFWEAFTKVLATRREPDPLADIRSLAAATRDLRAASGRLDARRVATTFGLSLTELARQIACSKQRVSKTPDGEALQPLLRPYERIARLRAALPAADFKAWLHTPNDHLEDRDAPIDYLKAGASRPLADFAENMLTGAPS